MEATTKPIVNYQVLISTFSWWKDVKGRIWVVISRQFTPTEEKPVYFIPNTVTLLERYKTEVVTQEWNEIVNLIETGKFSPVGQDGPA